MMAEHNKHLYYINELSDYKISDGYPDVRGWDVKDVDNRVIGKVDNLLVNKDAERVVYLDVEVDKSIIDSKYDPYGRPSQGDLREFVNKDGENHIIIPIGLVDVNQDSNYIYTDVIDHRTFAETKRYRKGDEINRNYENQVLGSYERRQKLYKDADGLNTTSSANRYDDDRKVGDNLLNDDDQFDNRNQTDQDFSDSNSLTNEHRFVDKSQRREDDFKMDEHRLRRIVREEIRKYHNDTDKLKTYGTAEDFHQSIDDDTTLSNDERELRRRRENNDVYDDDNFYERREFDDRRFNKRTPGL